MLAAGADRAAGALTPTLAPTLASALAMMDVETAAGAGAGAGAGATLGNAAKETDNEPPPADADAAVDPAALDTPPATGFVGCSCRADANMAGLKANERRWARCSCVGGAAEDDDDAPFPVGLPASLAPDEGFTGMTILAPEVTAADADTGSTNETECRDRGVCAPPGDGPVAAMADDEIGSIE